MMDVRVLIVDDEPLARLGITERLKTFADMRVVGECGTAHEALDAIPRLSPDLIFVDVELPGLSGLELLRALPQVQSRCIVFLTAHEEYALEAFEFEALDYLLKPLDEVRFAGCIERVRRALRLHDFDTRFQQLNERLASPPCGQQGGRVQRFPVRKGNDVMFIQAVEVDWIEGLGDYAGLHVGNRTHLVRETLSSLEARLQATEFLRIHRSTIVQVERILRVEPAANRDAVVTLHNGTRLRVSRTHRARLDSLLVR